MGDRRQRLGVCTNEQSFWLRVQKGIGRNACWLWKQGVHVTGYGILRFEGKAQFAHRVAWVLDGNDLPPRTKLMHTCGEPLCVRPEHLQLSLVSEDEINTIRELAVEEGITIKLLCETFQRSDSTIRRILRG